MIGNGEENAGVLEGVGVLLLREIVLIGLGVASGFPIPRRRQEDAEARDRRSDLRPMALATVSL